MVYIFTYIYHTISIIHVGKWGFIKNPVLSITSLGEIGFWEHHIEASKMQGRARGRKGERKTYHINPYRHITMEFGGYLLNVAKTPTRARPRKGEAQGVLSYQKATGIFDNPQILISSPWMVWVSLWHLSKKNIDFYAQKTTPHGKIGQIARPIAPFPSASVGSWWIVGCFPPKDPGLGCVLFPRSKWGPELFMDYLGGGGFKYFVMFTPKIGEDEPILTSIFFKWVGSTTNQIIHGGVILTTYI